MAGELDESQWREILDVAHAAADLPKAERREFVESVCSGPAVRERVLQLADEFDSHSQSLSFEIGSQIGRFTITGLLGRGGMGRVYSATDSELERTVALKVLHADLDGSTDSSRLIREARTASALNHPNIITVYEVLKITGSVAIVMEFVPGHSLRAWIPTPHTMADSLSVMAQIASAIEAAHAAGIVHRDLKPENVIVRQEKRVKVVDFGLARSVDLQNGSTNSATFATFAGTSRYMSPEQRSGASASAASDIYSLGVIFYEIVTGKYPFDDESLIDLKPGSSKRTPSEPSRWNDLISPEINDLIIRMLANSPAERPSAVQITEVLAGIEKGAVDPSSDRKPYRKPRRGNLRMVLGLGLTVLVAIVSWQWDKWESLFDRSRVADNFTVVPLANELGYYISPTFSPDGGQVAFSWNSKKQDNFDIYVEVVGSQVSRRLTTSSGTDYSPAWSPDGRTIAFCRSSETSNPAIWTMSAVGGGEKKIFDLHWRSDYGNRHLTWSADGNRISFPDLAPGGSKMLAIVELDLTTGASRRLTFPVGSQVDIQPAYSPDGRFLAFVRDQGGGVNRVYLLPLGEDKAAAPYSLEWAGFDDINISRPAWTPDSRSLVVVSNSGTADARPFIGDAKRKAKPRFLPLLGSNIYDATISLTGRLAAVYQHYDSDIYKLDLRRLRQGVTTVPEAVANSTRLERNPKVSPDGQKLAFESNRSGHMEIWTVNTDGSNPIPLTDMHHPVTGSPSWSHDGRRIVFDSRLGGAPRLYVLDAAIGKPQPVTSENDNAVVPSWSADDWSLYFASDRGRAWEIWRIPVGGGNPEQITHNGGFAVSISPDGELLYYSSDRARVTALRALHLQTNKEVAIASDVLRRNYVAVSEGVYYVSGPFLRPHDLKLADISGHTRQIFRFERPLSEGLDVSPDGSTLYFGQLEQDGTELMLVNGFWH